MLSYKKGLGIAIGVNSINSVSKRSEFIEP